MELLFEQHNFLVGLLEGFLQQDDVLLVLFALDHDFFDGAFLLAQDLDGLGVTALLLIKFAFHVTDASLQLADDALATNNGVGFNFFQANGQILDFNFKRLLDSFDLDDAFLFFVKNFNGVLNFSL